MIAFYLLSDGKWHVSPLGKVKENWNGIIYGYFKEDIFVRIYHLYSGPSVYADSHEI